MPSQTVDTERTEAQFAAQVDALVDAANRSVDLTDLLREDHPFYDQRGTAATVRMRGWILLALARVGVSDAELLYVLEELDTGVDPYLVAAAARALRSYDRPSAALAPFLMRAIVNIRYHDQRVCFDRYGEYAVSSAGTTAVCELLATLAWLGPSARSVLREIEQLRAHCAGLPQKLLLDVARAEQAIRGDDDVKVFTADTCCELPSRLIDIFSRVRGVRRSCEPIEQSIFQDQAGASITFSEFFRGQPSIVVFFYTRCDNPLKCSLTITKLARVQTILAARGLADRVHVAAITYDPGFDLPERLRRYGESRGVRMDVRNRMLRATDGLDALRRHFKLGVNFIGSLVNRHRIEAYILDAEGRIASSFERIHWHEEQLVNRIIEVLAERPDRSKSDVAAEAAPPPAHHAMAAPLFGTIASVGVAFFPKCPICWAAYLSMLGIAGLEQLPYSPWLQPALAAVMLLNLASVWRRARSTGRMISLLLVVGGALAILVSQMDPRWEGAAIWGVGLTLAGSALSVQNLDVLRVRTLWATHFTSRTVE